MRIQSRFLLVGVGHRFQFAGILWRIVEVRE